VERLKEALRPAYYFARSVAHALLAPLHAAHEWASIHIANEAFLLLGLHAIGAVVWVGGMFFALAILRPAMQELDATSRVVLHRAVLRRFLLVVWVAMPFMLLTGWRMMSRAYGRLSWVPFPVLAMGAIGAVMGVVFLAIWFGPYRRLRAAVSVPEAAVAVNAIRWLIMVNLVLGLLATFFAGLG
jgi:uncharacterized membrane protein